MAQYIVYTEDGNYRVFSYNGITFRDGWRGDNYVIDKTLTPIGFDGDENIDWVNIEEHYLTEDVVELRDGVRDGKYVLDAAITPTGFDGDIDIDWINIEEHE